MNPKRKKLRTGLGIYAALWVITGVWGLPQVDRAFDREFAVGSDGISSVGRPARRLPTSRVPYKRVIEPTGKGLPNLPFRSRSRGFPIAPFVIIDEICEVQTPFAGFSGQRVVFWLFGYSYWFPIRVWWVA